MERTELPLVSVITPVYNAARWLPATLASVRAQTLTDWEHILVDDGSTDRSLDILETAAREDARFRVLRMERNSGPAVARNFALNAAQGRFIAILDADDLWAPEKLFRCVEFMTARNYGFVYHDSWEISESGERIGRLITGPEELNMRTLHVRRGIRTCAVTIDLNQIPDFYFPDNHHEDFCAWLNLIQLGYIGHRLPGGLCSYRVSGHSRNSSKLRSALQSWDIYRHVSGLSLARAANWWTHYVLISLWTRRLWGAN
ncbi:MAG: glycosyltransferase family 2 protein [Terracidiphilus sp.]|jgi:teichuronic acid biosynthesis glycosyltransferase TuaG